MNVTRIWFAGYINNGTAAGIYALRRLKVKRCGELALRLSSRLTFAYFSVLVRANLTVNMPLRIRVGVHRVFPLTLEPILWTGVGQVNEKGWPKNGHPCPCAGAESNCHACYGTTS